MNSYFKTADEVAGLFQQLIHTLHLEGFEAARQLYNVGSNQIFLLENNNWKELVVRIMFKLFYMTEKENELQRLIGNIDDTHYLYTYDIRELSETDFQKKLEKITEKNKQTLAAIKELIDSGVDLNFKTQNGRSVMGLAVVRNNVELVELLLSYGVSLQETGLHAPLYRAAEFGADKVVKYLIEEKGLNPREGEYSVLGVARSSPYSHNVLPYLIEVMKKTKAERQPPPKKMEELTEDNMLKWYPQIAVPAAVSKKLQDIVESQFLIMYSTKLQWFYETIESHDPALIFACIDLIKKAITTEPKDKVVKTVKSPYAHHGNLVKQLAEK